MSQLSKIFEKQDLSFTGLAALVHRRECSKFT